MRIHSLSTLIPLSLLASSLVGAQTGATASTASMLPADTEVELRLAQNLSSANASVGDLVSFQVVEDIKQGEKTIIPHDAQAIGHVSMAEPKKWAGRGGKLSVMVDFVRLPDGRKLKLSAERREKAGGHTGAMTGAMVASAIVFFPAAPLFLMMHGKEMVLPQGTVVQSFTADDLPLTASAAAE